MIWYCRIGEDIQRSDGVESRTSSSRSFLKHRHAARCLKPSPSYVLVWLGLNFMTPRAYVCVFECVCVRVRMSTRLFRIVQISQKKKNYTLKPSESSGSSSVKERRNGRAGIGVLKESAQCPPTLLLRGYTANPTLTNTPFTFPVSRVFILFLLLLLQDFIQSVVYIYAVCGGCCCTLPPLSLAQLRAWAHAQFTRVPIRTLVDYGVRVKASRHELMECFADGVRTRLGTRPSKESSNGIV